MKPGRIFRTPVVAAAFSFVLAAVALICFGLWWRRPWLALLGFLGGGFFAYFFRDPERPIPADPQAVVAPADGKVVIVDEVREDQFLQGPAKRLAIFMNVFDVHVNRAPVAGTVTMVRHRPGKFLAAFRRQAGWENEQQATGLAADCDRRVLVVQIAGLLARRIISFVQPGQSLGKGERLGMICFGSRVDLYLPPDCDILVQVGDRLKAGRSIVARLWWEAA